MEKVNLKIVLIVIACFAAYLFYACQPDWQLARLERNARKVITPKELQDWALCLLSAKPTNSTPKVSELGTNYPAALLGLYLRPPHIEIQESNSESPESVFLMWGGAVVGHCGFHIGPTNLVSPCENARQWQPGVFFWSDRP